ARRPRRLPGILRSGHAADAAQNRNDRGKPVRPGGMRETRHTVRLEPLVHGLSPFREGKCCPFETRSRRLRAHAPFAKPIDLPIDLNSLCGFFAQIKLGCPTYGTQQRKCLYCRTKLKTE